MKIFVEVTDIVWDADGEDTDLPTEMKIEVPVHTFMNESEIKYVFEAIEEYISDELSNLTGFCHTGFSIS